VAVGGDPLEALASLRDRADRLVQTMAAAQEPAAAFTGADGSGAVTATVTGAGEVSEVVVDRAWRQRLGPDGLPGAVVQAVEAAMVARLQAWGEAFTAPGQQPAARPMPLPGETVAARLDELATVRMTSARGRAVLRELLAMAEAVERDIDETAEQIRAQASDGFTGRSRSGEVSVRLAGDGSPVEVVFDRRWLRHAHEVNIGRQTVQAWQAAHRKASEAAAGHGALAEAQALSQDPRGLARRLHLRDD
jgi:DNA-binding protein YbaB